MPAQRHTENYQDGHLDYITFTPAWSGHKGLHHKALGEALWHRFPIIGWTLRPDGDLAYRPSWVAETLTPEPNPLELVHRCQQYIYSLMDEAYHQIKLTQAIEEVGAERICVP